MLADAGPDGGDRRVHAEVGDAHGGAHVLDLQGMLDRRDPDPDLRRVDDIERRELLHQSLVDHVRHQVGAEASARQPIVGQHGAERLRPAPDRGQPAGVRDVGLDADAQLVAAGDVADDGRFALGDQHQVFRLHEGPKALDVEVGEIAHGLGLEEHQRVDVGVLERLLDFRLLQPVQLSAGKEDRVLLGEGHRITSANARVAASTAASSTWACVTKRIFVRLLLARMPRCRSARLIADASSAKRSTKQLTMFVCTHVGLDEAWVDRGKPGGKLACQRMVTPQRTIGILERHDRGGRDQARLAHAAAQHLRRPARPRHERTVSGQDRADRTAQPLAKRKPHRIGVPADFQDRHVQRAAALNKRAPSR